MFLMEEIRVNIGDILLCLSSAQNIISPIISRHNEQVAYLSFKLCEQLNISSPKIEDVFLAALVHDIGALSVDEQLELIETEPPNVNSHAFKGAKLIKDFAPLKAASYIIKYHHLPWDYGRGNRYMGESVPAGSHIIHLADRVCAQFKTKYNVISQVPQVLESIEKHKGAQFVPEYVDALCELSRKEYIWLDLMSDDPIGKLPEGIMGVIVLEMEK
ncbi:MAG: Uncharacterized protein XD50_1044 [Clostridia bacterium 41_269]|nr:MAG: Uncharacterized protein XD50_1044 [Clostridia bacterium 41_269]